jgi:hypothetical protein
MSTRPTPARKVSFAIGPLLAIARRLSAARYRLIGLADAAWTRFGTRERFKPRMRSHVLRSIPEQPRADCR